MIALRLGVVGVGGRGESLVRAAQGVAEVALTCVADVVRERAEAVAQQSGTRAFTSHVELMESGLADAVLIGTPHPFHAQIAVDAAQRGLHVLCEKPLAVQVAEADRMVAAAREAGVRLGVMFQRRLEPQRRRAHDLIAEGALGRLYDLEMVSTGWYRRQAYYDSGAWRGTWKGEGGGILANQSPHDLDMLAWLGGMPLALTATLARRVHRIEVEDTVQAVLDYGAGRIGTYRATTADPLGRHSVEVAGELGRLALRDGKLLCCRYAKPVSEDILHTPHQGRLPFEHRWEELPVEEQRGRDTTKEVIAQFARAVAEGAPLAATGEDGVRALELANAMHLSGLRRQRVELPVSRQAVRDLYADLWSGRIGLEGDQPR